MGIHVVMDRSGDSRHEFDAKDLNALTEAETRFRDLTAKGYRAVAFGKEGGTGQLLREFDPTVTRTVFIPALVGG